MAKSRFAKAKTEASSPAEHRKNLIRLLHANSHRHQLRDVFADFCELGALAISNSVDWTQRNVREERYLRIIKKYEPSEAHRFPEMLAELTMAMEYGHDDVLGQVFGELEMGNDARGQYFTPYEVCQVMASLTIGGDRYLAERLAERGFVTVNEPACGAGAMAIAFAEALTEKGFNSQRCLHITAQDIDSRAIHMAYLQLSLLHIPATLILGNTIMREESELWYTPAHILGGWSYKLSKTLDVNVQQNDQPTEIAPAMLTDRPKKTALFTLAKEQQLALF